MQVEVISTSSSRKPSAFIPQFRPGERQQRTFFGQHELTRRLTLKYSEQFEHDYDNDNYSNYVEDVSVHTGDSYQSECAMARIYWDELGQLYSSFRTVFGPGAGRVIETGDYAHELKRVVSGAFA